MNTTTEKVKPGELNNSLPEFGRTEDVRRVFGLKRGTLYNLWKQRRVRSVLVRVTGRQTGVRLWDMGSIRDYLITTMGEYQTAE